MAAGFNKIQFQSSETFDLDKDFSALLEPSPPGVPEDFDAAARRYLGVLFEKPANASFAILEDPDQELPDLSFKGAQELPVADTTVAEYTQKWRGIPIYGARVGVEMTSSKQLVNISGYVASPTGVNPLATLSPAEARKIVMSITGQGEEGESNELSENAPQLMLRFNEAKEQWNLVYVFNNIRISEEATDDANSQRRQNLFKVFIDAHSGEEIARLPQRHSLGPVDASGVDADGTQHQFTATEVSPGKYILEDPARRIRTLSMEFKGVDCVPLNLPTSSVTSDSPVFDNAAAIVAHANAARVYDFFFNVLRRKSVDGKGMWLISLVECLEGCTKLNPDKTFDNAFWSKSDNPVESAEHMAGLMMYGQSRWSDGKFHSFAESLDIVGHELTHGVTNYTCNLEYVVESGALNESYSDIFGTAISNAHRNDVSKWNWELGEELSSDNRGFRNMRDPGLGTPQQPGHMDDFIRMNQGEKPKRSNDYGYVHYNSGIHNKAAYNLFTDGTFTWQQVMQMFYLTLVTPGRLTATSTFADSKAGMVLSCASLLKGDPTLKAKQTAVRKAFSAAGI